MVAVLEVILSEAPSMMRTARTIAVGLLMMGALGCRERVPLPTLMACSQILQVRLGMSRGDVHARIGAPTYANADATGTEPQVTHWEGYQYPPPELFHYHDRLMLGYDDHRLTFLRAERLLGGQVVDRAKGNPVLAYRLSLTEAGDERREFGPAFEEVFQCEPGFARPKDE